MSSNEVSIPVWHEKHQRAAPAQLGGTIAFDWSVEGLAATLRMSKDRTAR